jgi:lipoprotein-anchoring transpeptidase ErfK/SrfK
MDDPPGHPHRRVRRPLLVGVVALIAAIAIATALLLRDGLTGAAVSPHRPTAAARNSVGDAVPNSIADAARKSIAALAPKPRILPVPSAHAALVAGVQRPTQMRSSPGGHAYARVPTRTRFGSSEAMWVVQMSEGWLGVVSPLAGNGKVGWIPARVASLRWVTWQLRVKLSQRRLTVLDRGKVRARYTIAVGATDAPTPTGRFAVTDRLRTGDPAGPYGCCILALSARAPHAISDWDGGNRIAIHSTTDTWSIGRPVSHGCLRLTLAEGQWLLAHIPLGTPAVVSA